MANPEKDSKRKKEKSIHNVVSMRFLLFMSGTRTIIMGWWIIFPSHSQKIFPLNSSVYDHQDLKFTHASPICTRVIFVPAQDVGLSSAFSNKRRFEEKKGMKSPGWSTSRTDLAVQQHFYYQRRVLIGKLKPLSYNLHLSQRHRDFLSLYQARVLCSFSSEGRLRLLPLDFFPTTGFERTLYS